MEDDGQNRKNLRGVGRRAAARGDVDRAAAVAAELYKPVEQWDWEELTRGRPRTRDGNFDAMVPTWLTPVVQREAERRLITMGKQKLAGYLGQAIETFAKLMTNEETDAHGKPIVPPSVKLDAAKFIFENIVGKATTRVEVEATEGTFGLLAGAMVMSGGSDAHPVVIQEANPETVDPEDTEGEFDL